MLARENPISDIIRSAMLKFHVDIHGYDMKDRKTPLTITKTADDVLVSLGDTVLTRGWLSEETSENITKDTEDVLILITGFAPNRKKVAAARNELARRIKSAFDRAVEVGWLEGDEVEFETDI